MGEMDRLIGAGILGLLWFGVSAFNAIYLYGHVRDWTLDGPSTLPIVGSVLGVAALLLAAGGGLVHAVVCPSRGASARSCARRCLSVDR